jgi:hypothetical protein
MVIFYVLLEVLGKFVNAVSQQRNLNFRGAGIALSTGVLRNHFGGSYGGRHIEPIESNTLSWVITAFRTIPTSETEIIARKAQKPQQNQRFCANPA